VLEFELPGWLRKRLSCLQAAMYVGMGSLKGIAESLSLRLNGRPPTANQVGSPVSVPVHGVGIDRIHLRRFEDLAQLEQRRRLTEDELAVAVVALGNVVRGEVGTATAGIIVRDIDGPRDGEWVTKVPACLKERFSPWPESGGLQFLLDVQKAIVPLPFLKQRHAGNLL